MLKLAVFAFCALLFPFAAAAQSTDVNFPTAVTTNEIDGTIKARDIGDSRLTSYFYTFDGGQGDVFINIVTRNFTGDIDVFAAEALRPLTKMVIYADAGVNETGRLIYLRKAERLILRVEGRSPNDDPATFRIKFAGSFIALATQKPQYAPAIKGSEVNAESGIRVNSVGTIVEVIPKPQPPVKEKPIAKEAVAVTDGNKKKSEPAVKKTSTSESKLPKKPVKESVSRSKVAEKKSNSTNSPAITPPAKTPGEVAKKDSAPVSKSVKRTDASEPNTVFKRPTKSKNTSVAKKSPTKTPKPPTTPEEKKPDPLARIRLLVQLKDGKMIERPMSEVQKFSVDNGVLTVIAKDGSSIKYSIFDVARVTIE